MANVLLTDAACRRYKPAKEPRRIRDGGGRSLFFIIHPTGHKSWQMRFRGASGKPQKITLGAYTEQRELTAEPDLAHIGTPLTLSDARLMAQKILRERKLGRDVIADHKARRSRNAIADAAAFGAVVRRYIEEHARPTTRVWAETAKVLGLRPTDMTVIPGGIAERWADKNVRDIDSHAAWVVIDEARRFGIPGIVARNGGASNPRGRRLRAALSSAFKWMRRQRLVDINPCADVDPPKRSDARDRVLDDAEIKKFWKAADAEQPALAVPLKILLLTGQRVDEVAQMERAELSDDGTTWSIPASRTKNKKPHVVPLSPMVRALIAAAPAVSEKFVFSTNGKVPVALGSKVKARLDAAMSIAAWQLRDLRRTAVTGMADLGIRPDVIELAVNHISGTRGGIAGVYNRSELMLERRAALARWAAHVEGLVSGKRAKVEQLRKSR